METSIIVPVYNGEKTIKKCIESIMKQRKVQKQIIVVDNCSTDSTYEILKEFGNRIIVLREEAKGAAVARNKGLDIARGKYVAFVDSDTILSNDRWLSKAIDTLEKHRRNRIVGVGGIGKSVVETDIAISLDFLLFGRSVKDKDTIVKNLPTMDLVMRKEDIGDVRFDPILLRAQDPEFCFNFVEKGYKFLFADDLWVYHLHPVNLRELTKRWFGYGLYYRLPYKAHPRQKDLGYYSRVCFIFVTLLFVILALVRGYFIMAILVEFFLLFFLYFKKFIKNFSMWESLKFSVIHTIKQLAQLFGIFLSYFGVKLK